MQQGMLQQVSMHCYATKKLLGCMRELACAYAGIDFLWRVVLDMPSHESQAINASQAVVRASQDLLIKLYQQRSTDGPVTPALCEHFIRYAAVCLRHHLLSCK